MQPVKRPITAMIFLLLVGLMLPFGLAAQETEMEVSTSPVQLFADASEVEGAWSRLVRYENGVGATVHSSGLPPGDVVTVWWVIFNDPSKCSDDACGEDDIFLFDDAGEMVMTDEGPQLNMEQIEATQNSVLGATGNLIPESGEGHFSAWLGVGDVPGILWGPALLDPAGAEIHLVLRSHGPMVADVFDDQISSFNGGCADEWPNEPCQDLQFAMHKPPA